MNLQKNDKAANLNIERFQALSDGDPASLVELIQLYRSKTSEQMQELQTAIRATACEEVARVAHSMVGANAMVGMDSLLPALRQLEELGERKMIGPAEKIFQELSKEYDRIQRALASYLPNEDGK